MRPLGAHCVASVMRAKGRTVVRRGSQACTAVQGAARARQRRQTADGCAAARQVNTNCEGKSLFTAPFQVGATPCLRFNFVPAQPRRSSSSLLPLR
jgi:hypothetical protein